MTQIWRLRKRVRPTVVCVQMVYGRLTPDAEPSGGDYDIKLYFEKFSDQPISNQFAILKKTEQFSVGC